MSYGTLTLFYSRSKKVKVPYSTKFVKLKWQHSRLNYIVWLTILPYMNTFWWITTRFIYIILFRDRSYDHVAKLFRLKESSFFRFFVLITKLLFILALNSLCQNGGVCSDLQCSACSYFKWLYLGFHSDCISYFLLKLLMMLHSIPYSTWIKCNKQNEIQNFIPNNK
jgi:hypothetical protein